jgi:magnesium transporter
VGVTTRLYCEGRFERRDVDPDTIDETLKQSNSFVWLDVDQPTEESMQLLGREFGFHELALEDCLHTHERPKVDQYGSYFFLIAYGVSITDRKVAGHEMGIFVGHNYLVTVRKDPPFDLSDVVERWDANPELAAEGGGFFLYILLDEIVDGYFDVLDIIEEQTEQIEDRIFSQSSDTETQTQIFEQKKELLRFRRAVAPLRDVLDVLQRRTLDVVTPRLEPYYRDVYDHVLRAADFVDSTRDLLSSALEANLSVISNRLNEVMKQLTAWAAIILIPTLVAGIYGMNFVHMPELRWRFGYAYALGLMALCAYLLYRMFKRRDWL